MLRQLLFSLLLPLLWCLQVPTCTSDHTPNLTPFTYTTNGTTDPSTSAHMCHDSQYLHIYWFCVDSDIISTYSKCNDPLYNQDAVEIFLATESSWPRNYFEFEVSPTGKLFFADITNANGNCSSLGTVYYPCSSAIYEGKLTEQGWQGYLKIELSIIGRGQKYSSYKGNLFRIDKSRTQPTRYLSYNPTMNSPACFHQPSKFIDFKLV